MMKKAIRRSATVLLILALTCIVSVAKTKRKTVTLSSNVTVSGTLLKSGTYDLVYDDKTNEISFFKGGKVVAKATGRLEKRDRKASDFQIITVGTGDASTLTAVAFAGSDQNIVIATTAGSTTGMQ